jgi:hypothetical protein
MAIQEDIAALRRDMAAKSNLARAFPETQIVLHYVGGAIGLGPYAGKPDEVFAEWSGKIRELAACPNVHVKLGGLGMRMFGFLEFMNTLADLARQFLPTRYRLVVEATKLRNQPCENARLPTETHFYVGAFDRAAELQPTRHIFAEEHLAWVHVE